MPNDVGDWGEKDISGAYDGPLNIAGEQVRLEDLPPLGDSDVASEPAEHPRDGSS